jgi:two-component system sensor histidine kinase HydH
MPPQPGNKTPDDKVKPFRMVKYFTYTSLIVIFIVTILISFFNTHGAKTIHLKKSEEYANLLIENLNHQIFLNFIIPTALKYGKIKLRDKEQYEYLDTVIRSTLHSFKVENVNIYDMNNIIAYSFDSDLMGRKGLGQTEYQDAVEGRTTLRLHQEGNRIEVAIGIPRKVQMVSFAPLRAEKPLSGLSGPVLGVIEVVQDITSDYRTIFDFQILVIATSATIMGVLFVVLIFVVKRGESISQQRTLERMRLKEQLSQAKHLSSIGEMTAVISHEIRNPLGIIRSSAGLLKKKVTAIDPANSIPDIIIEEAERLNNIITDFLSYARPRPLALVATRIEEIIQKNIEFLQPQLEQHNCTVTIDIQENLPMINADPEKLYQAFLNILINAMQAMPEGGKLQIDLRQREQDIVISFKDEGVGISEEIAEKIWDPFFTAKEKGTGLGLGVVKKIIETHQGRITLTNRSVRGSVVEITLPIEA